MNSMLFKIWVFSLILCLLSWEANAQAMVRGRIVDAQTKEPLVGATVMIDGTAEGEAADLDGSFILHTSQSGNRVLVFRSIGYYELKKEIFLYEDLDLGTIGLKTESIGLGDVTVTASVAVARKTPVAVTVIDPVSIENKLSTQEFPEILKSTPSIYATRQGGGFGDSRVNVRGFESENVAVMVNGIPVNEMESGRIYWSNWAGLADVTRSMQVQRGLGAAKVGVPSVGGSINIVTNTTEVKAGGGVSYALGNDGYNKISFHVSTGLQKGWAITLLGAKSWGNGYIQGTEFEGYSYFGNVSKQINDRHLLSLTVLGAPQWHNQRTDNLLIAEWQKQDNRYKYNAAYGFGLNGQRKVSGFNKFHKPQMSLNHYWNINEKSSLSTAFYVSIGRGGGYRGQGNSTYRNSWYATGTDGSLNTQFRAADGTFDYAAIYALNMNSENGSQMAMSNNINNHEWYGVLSTYTTRLGQYFNVYGGLDLRYYKGTHQAKLVDLYGGGYYVDDYNRKNVDAANNEKAADPDWKNEKLKVGDVVFRDYDGFVAQEGVFGQIEFNRNALATFVAGSISNTMYWRYDRFYYDKDHAKSDKSDFWSGTIKGGANYNIDGRNNVFANIGYISRAPFFEYAVFLNKENSNELNKDAVNEKIFSVELGYGFRSPVLTANLNVYRTVWMDKSMGASVTFEDSDERGRINMTGVDALHQGVELEVILKPLRNLELTGMMSLADWHWNSNASGYLFNDQGQPLDANGKVTEMESEEHARVNVDLKEVKVGNSAQTTFAFGADYQVLNGLRIGADYTHWARNYAKFRLQGSDLASRIGETVKYVTPWKIPSAGSMDVNMSYRFPFGKLWGTISANVNNVLDQEYIADAEDGTTHDWTTAQVYYGFGRTYSVRFKITF